MASQGYSANAKEDPFSLTREVGDSVEGQMGAGGQCSSERGCGLGLGREFGRVSGGGPLATCPSLHLAVFPQGRWLVLSCLACTVSVPIFSGKSVTHLRFKGGLNVQIWPLNTFQPPNPVSEAGMSTLTQTGSMRPNPGLFFPLGGSVRT